MEQQMIFSVSEANNFIKALLDRVPQLQEIFVRGEISNYKLYPAGHHYFTLKDAESSLRFPTRTASCSAACSRSRRATRRRSGRT